MFCKDKIGCATIQKLHNKNQIKAKIAQQLNLITIHKPLIIL